VSEENVEVVRRAYEAWNQGDDKGWASAVAAGFEYFPAGVVAGTESRYQGAEGFARYLRRFWDEFADARTEVRRLRDLGDLVLAEITFRGRGRQSGVETEMEAYQLWTLREGKIVRGEGFVSREGALEAAGLRE
jgi:ketosteroid isomerase-like protein